ncbi:MAG: hypothetical protein JWO91_1033 [Acidobacteriaceae bacterium]|nr:hypothetical protein [Acidobacteriaceae bacterium]
MNPFTFEPQQGGLPLTPLRAYAHDVPHYYLENFGTAVTNPDTNEYAAFAQDTIRVTNHLALSIGVRYDLQTFTTKGLLTNPLWPYSGQVPFNPYNFAPRVGLAYALGDHRPLVIRAGYGLFYTRIPQIYNSTIQSQNGISSGSLFLNNTNYYANQIFPQYPNPLVSYPQLAATCTPPPGLEQFVKNDISSFSPNFRTPEVHQASLTIEREVANRLAVGISYTFVNGQNLVRARDVNLSSPTNVLIRSMTLLVLICSVTTMSIHFRPVQFTQTFSCPFPPCINPLARPIPRLRAIDVFESEASSVYHGATLSIHRRMTSGLYFRLAYTYAHAMDDGQDALVAGRPALVQNSYSPQAEYGPSVTDQRQRFAFSWIADPKLFGRNQPILSQMFNNWKAAGVVTVGSGRPINATVTGDPNQDRNSENDRLPDFRRNSFVGPDYATPTAPHASPLRKSPLEA